MQKTEIARSTLSHQVYTWLRQQIISGHLKQGEHLTEQQISESLGVSATPVREALRMLNGDGIVELEGRRGVRVVEPSVQDIRSCFQVRKSLECLVLREAFDHMTPNDIFELERIKELLEKDTSPDPHAFLDADRAFHGFFLQLADNTWLDQFLSRLTDFLYVVRQPLLKTSTLAMPRQEHLAITVAVLTRDIDKAVELMGQHIDRVCDDVIARKEEHDEVMRATETSANGTMGK